MTDRKQSLIDLRDKVKAGDQHISSLLPIEHEAHWAKFYLAMDGSLDAAKALHEAVLPGWGWRVAQCHVSDDAWVMAPDNSLTPEGREWADATDIDQRPPGNPARAWLLAILEALIAQVGSA